MVKYGGCKPLLLVAMSLAIAGPAVRQSQGQGQPRARGPDENPQFFPSEVFGSNRSILARAYSWYLRSMAEKPLSEYVSPECPQVYRMLVETRPYNAPVVVRLWIRTDGVSGLVAKVGRDGGHPQILTVSKTIDPSPVGVHTFLQLLGEADFWSMPSQKPFDIHHVVMGEAGWMLEGTREGSYHLVHRVTSELGPLKDSLNFLVTSPANLDLGSLPVGPRGDNECAPLAGSLPADTVGPCPLARQRGWPISTWRRPAEPRRTALYTATPYGFVLYYGPGSGGFQCTLVGQPGVAGSPDMCP